MRKVIVGTFSSARDAEHVISFLQKDLGIPRDDISYVYKSEGVDGEHALQESSESDTTDNAATGAVVGGSVGAIAGIATVMGAIPVIGPIFAAGALIAPLGIGGAVGTMAAGTLTGAIAGGILGALVHFGASESEAKAYEERVNAGDVLLVVHSERDDDVRSAFSRFGATSVDVYDSDIGIKR